MMPRASPRVTWKLTSRNAQKSFRGRIQENRFFHCGRDEPSASTACRVYRFETFWNSTSNIRSDHIQNVSFDVFEPRIRNDCNYERERHGFRKHHRIREGAVQ